MPSTNPQKRLFVGSLPYSTTEEQLKKLFLAYGPLDSCRLIYDKWGKSRGIAYLEYQSLASAQKAKEALHGYFLQDRTIIVDYAKPDPFDTPEGKLKHQQARERHFKKLQHQESAQSSFSRSDSFQDPPSSSKLKPKTRQEQQQEQDEKNPIPVLSGEGFKHPKYKSKYAGKRGHLRDSVFNQRYFGSRQGKKFASKTKQKKKS